MREHFILITPDNAVKGVTTEAPGLEFYYEQIGCKTIEIVRISKNRTNKVFIVDEEGLLKENPEINAIASLIVKQPIYGNALLAKEGERNGEPDICGFEIKEAIAARLAIHVSLLGSGMFTIDDERGKDNED